MGENWFMDGTAFTIAPLDRTLVTFTERNAAKLNLRIGADEKHDGPRER